MADLADSWHFRYVAGEGDPHTWSSHQPVAAAVFSSRVLEEGLSTVEVTLSFGETEGGNEQQGQIPPVTATQSVQVHPVIATWVSHEQRSDTRGGDPTVPLEQRFWLEVIDLHFFSFTVADEPIQGSHTWSERIDMSRVWELRDDDGLLIPAGSGSSQVLGHQSSGELVWWHDARQIWHRGSPDTWAAPGPIRLDLLAGDDLPGRVTLQANWSQQIFLDEGTPAEIAFDDRYVGSASAEATVPSNDGSILPERVREDFRTPSNH